MSPKTAHKKNLKKASEPKLVGGRIAQVRNLYGLSQKEVEAKVGIPWRSYQKYETGVRQVSAEFVWQFCKTFSVRLDWLMSGKGEMIRFDDHKTIKETVLLYESVVDDLGRELPPLLKASILSRLLSRLSDGYNVRRRDVVDYIELANGGFD